MEDAGPDEAGDDGADNDDDDDRGELADAAEDVYEVDGEDADAEEDVVDNASMLIRRTSVPMIRTLFLSVVYGYDGYLGNRHSDRLQYGGVDGGGYDCDGDNNCKDLSDESNG